MSISIKSVTALSLGAFAFILLNGCSTVTSGVSQEPIEITVGMSSLDVLLQLGKPSRVKEREVDGALLEVWIYNITRHSHVDMRQTGTREVPYIDPITGQHRMVSEPELMPEITKFIETTEIFFDNERVVTWNQTREVDRNLIE